MELKEIRQHLDRIDNAILIMIAERMSLIPKVAEYKKKNNIPRYHPDREKEIIDSKRKMASENGINPDFAERIFREIIKESHVIEEGIMGG